MILKDKNFQRSTQKDEAEIIHKFKLFYSKTLKLSFSIGQLSSDVFDCWMIGGRLRSRIDVLGSLDSQFCSFSQICSNLNLELGGFSSVFKQSFCSRLRSITSKSNNQGNFKINLLGSFNNSVSNNVAAQNSSENVNEDCIDFGVRTEDFEGSFDLVDISTTTDI